VQLPDRAAVLRWVRWVAALAMLWSLAVVAAMAVWGGEAFSRAGSVGSALIAATLASFAINHGLRFVRWQLLLRAEGMAPPWRRSLSIFLAGLALLPTPAKAGVAVRSLLLLGEGVPVHVSLAAYVVERLTDLVGLVILASLLFGALTGHAWAIAAAVAVAGLVLVKLAPALVRRVKPDRGRWPRAARAFDWVDRFFVDATEMLSGWRLPAFVLIGGLANVATGLLLWFSLRGGLDAAAGIGVLALSHLSGSISMLPGGLGGFELAMLAQLGALRVPPGEALASLAAVRFATLWGSVLVGLPLLFVGLRRGKGVPPTSASAPASPPALP
jgi:uncharacterized membrane protein YbhN (UPF0104 family)